MKISIITVCYNSERFIGETISSVLTQSNVDLEYVIVDGGSVDGTVEVIQRYAESDGRIIWCSEPDHGIADAMNKGVAMASGSVVAHLNSDDYYAHPQVLARIDGCFTDNPQASWLTGGFTFVSKNGTFIKNIRVRRYSFSRLVRGNILLHPATFIRRDLFNAVGGFDPTLNYCMDYELFLRLGEIADPITHDEQLACFRVHDASRSLVHAEKAYAEEYRVRMDYLRQHGRLRFFYVLDYHLKRHLNKLFYRSLFARNRASAHA